MHSVRSRIDDTHFSFRSACFSKTRLRLHRGRMVHRLMFGDKGLHESGPVEIQSESQYILLITIYPLQLSIFRPFLLLFPSSHPLVSRISVHRSASSVSRNPIPARPGWFKEGRKRQNHSPKTTPASPEKPTRTPHYYTAMPPSSSPLSPAPSSHPLIH